MWGSAPKVSADRGSTAAGGDIIGILPEQLPAILKAATDPLERLNAEQRDTIAQLERQLGSTQEQILGFFRFIGEAGITVEAMPGKLVEIAEHYQGLVAQAAAAPSDDPETARLKVELHAALERVDLDRADAILAEILGAQDRDLERRALEAAATCAQRGQVAMTRLRYREAAAHFAAAVNRVPVARETERIDYLNRQALALYLQGEEFGDNPALQSAADAWRALLILCPVERVPLDWAMTQNNLGTALLRLGERKSGTARLEQAVAAYDAALKERTRERGPLQWATTQANRGTALLRLGEREAGTARLEQAVAAYDAALKEYTRERVPLQWAMTENNRGNALLRLGERESGTARLEQAVTAYVEALK